jgi:hypothetical protein
MTEETLSGSGLIRRLVSVALTLVIVGAALTFALSS